MSYFLVDADGYVDDFANIAGLKQFSTWAAGIGGAVGAFAREGYTDDPEALALQLKDVPAIGDVVGMRDTLRAAAAKAQLTLVLSDGLGDDVNSTPELRAGWYDPALGYDPHGREEYAGQGRQQARMREAGLKGEYHDSAVYTRSINEPNFRKLAQGMEKAGGKDSVIVQGEKRFMDAYTTKILGERGVDQTSKTRINDTRNAPYGNGYCHQNAASRWASDRGKTVDINTGYYMDPSDKTWRSHSWLTNKKGQILEMNRVARGTRYFGVKLNDKEARVFSKTGGLMGKTNKLAPEPKRSVLRD